MLLNGVDAFSWRVGVLEPLPTCSDLSPAPSSYKLGVDACLRKESSSLRCPSLSDRGAGWVGVCRWLLRSRWDEGVLVGGLACDVSRARSSSLSDKDWREDRRRLWSLFLGINFGVCLGTVVWSLSSSVSVAECSCKGATRSLFSG